MADQRTVPGWAVRGLLPVLLLLSGFCGISYEILYTKLLGNLLGNQFTINATVLLTFLLGIGFGTLYAHRLLRWLWLIEAGIGIYAALMALAYGGIDRLLYRWLPFLGTSIFACAAVSFVLLLFPAFLIGCSVPIFAAYLGGIRKTQVFSMTYGIYNIGAGLTALAMEFVLLRAVGLRASTLLLALLNLVVAGGLLALGRRAPLAPPAPLGHRSFPRRVLAALVLASIASAVFQLMMIKVAEFIFGPYNETFSLVLATVLLGLAIGSAATARLGLTFNGALLLAVGGLIGLLALMTPAMETYATLYPDASRSYLTLVALKFGLVFTLVGLPAIGFGATIPALMNTHRHVARESGQLLFVSSLANATGFLLMAFVLHRMFDYGPLLWGLTALTVLALLVHSGPRPRLVLVGITAICLAGAALAGPWNEMLFYIGHTNFHDVKDLRDEQDRRLSADRFKGPQDVFAITWKNGRPYFFINGYISIPLNSTTEKLVGAVSSMLAPRLDEALVLGVGSGATASTVGLAFDHTDVVEINRVVLQNLYRMKEYNFDIETRPQISIVHDDGIHFIKTTPRKYSLILNTVTTPLYFSSSKLYTLDFFDAVAERLTPDGIYVTWIDYRIGDRGLDIILETLSQRFEQCWMYYMDANYFILVASNQPIALRQHASVLAKQELSEFFASEYQLPLRVVPYSVLATDVFALKTPRGIPTNTLDYPVLEFEMAKLQSKANLTRFHGRLQRRIDLRRIRDTLQPAMQWDPAEFLFYADLRLGSSTRLSRMLFSQAASQLGTLPSMLGPAALRMAGEVGSAQAHFDFGRELRRRDLWPPAIAAFERALDLDPTFDDANYYLARSLASAGEAQRAADHFLAEWALDRDERVPERLGRSLLELRRYDEALAWLETAQAIDAGLSEDADLAYYRGEALEGLGDLSGARRFYLRARAADTNHEQARDALLRLDGRRARR